MTDSASPGDAQPSAAAAPPRPAPAWQPLDARQRRIVGVLVEKAKTTPDAYPLSINALRTGANQKNNRYPLMELESDDVEEGLDRLRALGAVSEVQGDGRVLRYRHLLYDWLGVEKLELAVMAELLLRGAQSEGDLRARAGRMDPIPDLTTLRNVLAALKAKRLVVGLTAEGRGHVVTHNLYRPAEMEALRAEYHTTAGSERSPTAADSSDAEAPRRSHPPAAAPVAPEMVSPRHAGADLTGAVAELRSEVEQLRGELDTLRRDFDDLRAQLG